MSDNTSLRKNRRRTVLTAGHGEEAGESWLMSYADFMTLMCSFFVLLTSTASMDDSKVSKLANQLSKYFNEKEMDKMAKNLQDIKKSLEQDLHFGSNVKTTITENGLEIMFTGSAIFESGKADILETVSAQLDTMIDLIKKKNRTYKILVEGHTDDAPIKGGGFTSNRELSGARSSRIVDRFVKAGFDPNNIIAIGYGETRPLASNRDQNGKAIPENMQLNRRVVIKVLDTTSTDKLKSFDKDSKKPENAFFNDQKIIKN